MKKTFKTDDRQVDIGNQKIRFRRLFFAIAGILILTFICYIPSIHNDFLKTWDDRAYVTNNELITSLSIDNIKRIFIEDKGLYANYHPVTTLSLAVNYYFSKLDPAAYHLTNILLHLLNTILVFIFIYLLGGKKIVVAALVALWFGVTPIHVESVAWISERKDVLYTFFYLGSLISYIYYIKHLRYASYLITLLLFFLSLLSKAMAASLPLILFLIDYISNRKFSARIIIEKIPFLFLSIVLGIYAIHIQAESGSTDSSLFSFFRSAIHASYGFVIYIYKIFVPTNLSAFYPYPYPLVNSGWVLDNTPIIFYFTSCITLCIFSFTGVYFFKRKPFSKIIVFGLLFYLVSIALVLQFMQVGRAIMADRYSYIPSIGLFFIVAEIGNYILNQPGKWKNYLLSILLVIYTGILCYNTFVRNKVWKNDETLWTDVIKKYPDDGRVVMAYYFRGSYYYELNKKDKALEDFLSLIKYSPKDVNVLVRIGKLYGQDYHDLVNAIIYFQKAYDLDSTNVEVLRDLATAHGMNGDYEKSLKFSLKAVRLVPNDSLLYVNIAVSYQNMGNKEKADEFFRKAHKHNPNIKQ